MVEEEEEEKEEKEEGEKGNVEEEGKAFITMHLFVKGISVKLYTSVVITNVFFEMIVNKHSCIQFLFSALASFIISCPESEFLLSFLSYLL